MEEKKNPRSISWRTWILVITAIQALSAIQSYRIHDEMWKAILDAQSAQNQVLQIEVEYHQILNTVLDQILQVIRENQ